MAGKCEDFVFNVPDFWAHVGNLTFRVHAAPNVYDAQASQTSTLAPGQKTSSPTPPALPVHPVFIIAALAAGGVVVSVAQTLIIPLITHLPHIYDASPVYASWIFTVTLVA